eukprot:Rmarinus@m.21642
MGDNEDGPTRVAVGDLRRRSFQNQLKELDPEGKETGGLRSHSMPGKMPMDEEDADTGTNLQAVKRFTTIREMKKSAAKLVKKATGSSSSKPKTSDPVRPSPLHQG